MMYEKMNTTTNLSAYLQFPFDECLLARKQSILQANSGDMITRKEELQGQINISFKLIETVNLRL